MTTTIKTPTTALVETTRCGGGTVLETYAGTGEVLTVTVTQSHGKKLPSCYAGKTFVLTHDRHTVSTNAGRVETWDVYTATFKNGKAVTFTRFNREAEGKPAWFVKKEAAFAGNWVTLIPAV